ncbi:DUF1707 SHOCT-like domain-containing protein [Actinospica robiniae]|uniref:DUF1707 SHOCT-like domain-containing protein n=1 Tax=Actinospica robiniae TaxID=304901 RepID=UPI0004044DBA|nr:DUF1707 domain-containing protein [Actinospica robiniae]
MSDPDGQTPPALPADEVRAADADREATAERLRSAAAEGRIDLAELDERLEQAYLARTYGELRVITADLPTAPLLPASRSALPEPETLVLRTTAPNLKQAGHWTVPRKILAETKSGIITIDFTQATCAYEQIEVEAVTKTGWIRLILPDGWAAQISPSSTNTARISNKAAGTPAPGAPTVIVNGHPVFGPIKIRQRHNS